MRTNIGLPILAVLALVGGAYAQTSSSGPIANATATQILTSGTSFTTSVTVPSYKVIVVGPGGGGGSSTGAGSGGSGASGNLTVCEVQGGGLTYTYAIGAGGAKGAAGSSGSAGGTATSFGDTTNCAATSGNGGTNGTASAGAGGTAASANTCAAFAAITNNLPGTCLIARAGLAGSSGSAFQPTTYGAGQGGAGCAGASCTTDTAGTAGEVILIPEVY